MKRTGKKVLGAALILAGVFAIFAALAGMKDCKAIKNYKQIDRKQGERVSELEEALQQLKENESAYQQGLLDYASGQDTLTAGGDKLTKAQAAYDEGVKKLEQGRETYAAGLKKIEENTQAYNEGKEKLAKIEPLLPYVDTYVAFRDKTISKLPGFDSAQAWFVSVVAPVAAKAGLEIPADVKDFPGYIEDMVADGRAKIQQYEDGLVALEEAKAKVIEGEAKLEAAKKDLDTGYQTYDDGAKKLDEGKAKLDTFEDGMRQVNEFTNVFFTQPEVYRHNGSLAIPNTKMRMEEGYSWVRTDDSGKAVTMLNGEPYLELDKCMEVCQTFREMFKEQIADATQELEQRLVLYIALAVTGVLAIVSGVFGLLGKGTVLGLITAALAVAENIFGACTRYTGYTYQVRNMGADGEYLVNAAGEYSYTYSGTVQLIALLTLAAVAAAFAVCAIMSKKKAVKAEQ